MARDFVNVWIARYIGRVAALETNTLIQTENDFTSK
jgi:hypothetical protein